MFGKGDVSLLCWIGRDQTIEKGDTLWYNYTRVWSGHVGFA